MSGIDAPTEAEPCCNPWRRSLQSGTDGEGYGCLITNHGDGFYAGSIEDEIEFCPWCGAKKVSHE